MRVIAANNDEVGVVLTKAEAALITAALSAHNADSLRARWVQIYHVTEATCPIEPLKLAMPMFDWLKKWVTGQL